MAKLEISKVHDAYDRGGECPLCDLYDAVEASSLSSLTHSRVMEPSVRVRTNDRGFCPAHLAMLYRGENKLGLGLMLHTHLQERIPGIENALDAIAAGQRQRDRDRAAAALSALLSTCYLCELLETDMKRYRFTILYLWQKDAEFRPRYRASRGFCIRHFVEILNEAEHSMRSQRLSEWLQETVPLMKGSLGAVERDLYAFTQLHHDANRGLGTEEERTALGRALQKLAGGRFSLQERARLP
jgi:hypothetical protein